MVIIILVILRSDPDICHVFKLINNETILSIYKYFLIKNCHKITRYILAQKKKIQNDIHHIFSPWNQARGQDDKCKCHF